LLVWQSRAFLEAVEDHVDKLLRIRAEAGLGKCPANGGEVDSATTTLLDGVLYLRGVHV
jgi:hypothetical protein